MPVRRGLHAWARRLLDLVYPPHCVVCERGGAWLCGDCLASVVLLPAPRCPHCGRPMPATELCAACRAQASFLMGIRSVGYYAPPLREAIHALKYNGVRVLAEPLGELLAEAYSQSATPVSVIVPVPLHRTRLRYRGYNQAVLLARAFGTRVGLPVVSECLARNRATRSQVGLNADERRANVQAAFVCTDGTLRGERVLLLDDVFTTGATLEACAQALLDGGATGVWALTLARALGPS
jgi:ComF family protein